MANSNNSNGGNSQTTMMRIAPDQRPYVKDLFDIFAALLIQLPLTDHRSLFRTYADTFTTDEAVQCLADLKISHIVKTKDPKDPKQTVATRTTTTFSMTPPMAKALGTHMLNARLIEDAVNPTQQSRNTVMKDKGIWRPTPKGKHVIMDFAKRTYVPLHHMQQQLARIDSFGIYTFERLQADDRLLVNRTNMENAFKMMLAWLPTERLIADDVVGVKPGDLNTYQHTFYGYQCFEWICEYTTVANADEAHVVAAEFVANAWICEITDKPTDKRNSNSNSNNSSKSSSGPSITKNSLYYLGESGYKVLRNENNNSVLYNPPASSDPKQLEANRVPFMTTNTEEANTSSHHFFNANESDTEPLVLTNSNKYSFGIPPKVQQPSPTTVNQYIGGSSAQQQQHSAFRTTGTTRSSLSNDNVLGVNSQPGDSNWMRMNQILEDPLSRMYFRDFLKTNYCEENINFWVDFRTLRRKSHVQAEMKELLMDIYTIYQTYLERNARSEVNIDHSLRSEIIQFMSSNYTAMSPMVSVREPADIVVDLTIQLYDRVNDQVCRILAEDLVPRFSRTPKYRELFPSS